MSLDNIQVNSFVVVLAPKDENDPYYFNIPKAKEKVWIARVLSIIKENDMYYLKGWFASNQQRDLTKPLIFCTYTDCIEFKEESYVGNFTNLPLTNDSVKQIRSNIRRK